MKRIGFLSFGHYQDVPGSLVHTAADSLLQTVELAVAAEEVGVDGAYVRVHHFANQLASPFPLLAAMGVRTKTIELGTARATIRTRMERLEQSGDIIGYTVMLKSDAAALPVRGIMMIEVEGHSADRVLRALNGFSEISAIHTTNGRWDLVVEISAQNLADLDAVLRRMRLIDGITASETNLLLATPRSTRARL